MNESNCTRPVKAKQCIVGCCEKDSSARGYCNRHYKQMKTLGEIDDRHEMFRFTRGVTVLICPVCLNCFSGEARGMNKRVTCSMRCMGIKATTDAGAEVKKHRACLLCGEGFVRGINSRSSGEYCSRKCSALAQLRKMPSNIPYTESQRNTRREIVLLRSIRAKVKRYFYNKIVGTEIASLRKIRRYRLKTTKVIGVCGCGSKFIRMNMDHKYGGSFDNCNTCRAIMHKESKIKGRRKSKLLRRARMAGAEKIERIDPIQVLESFNWTCYICKKKTPKRLRGTYDDRAPEVDHIVPLSKGGHHVMSNLACACRSCNAMKSDNEMFLI